MKLWPRLDYRADRSVIETLHAYCQVIGKLLVRTLPWHNHGWHTALRVVPRGLRTYPLIVGDQELQITLDLQMGAIIGESSSGRRGSFAIAGQSVAAFTQQLDSLLRELDAVIDLSGGPNEVEDPVPFADDTALREWDVETALHCHAAFRSANRTFENFRTGFVGKSSPSHLFWGSFDLAVTRFSGRTAPLHPGGIPALPDAITREAYSHENASAGFWLGGNGADEAMFYAYGYPTPDELANAAIEPAQAWWHTDLEEFVLPYAAVAAADDPEATLLRFLESTYAAIADRADWPRGMLDIPRGTVGKPRDVKGSRAS